MVRIKERYILVQVRCNDKPADESVAISSTTMYHQLCGQVERYYGEFGIASMLHLRVVYFNDKTHLCIIQSRHGPHRFITSILPLITTAGTQMARYRILYVGATVKQCQKFIIKYQQRYINKTIGNYRGEMQKQQLIADVTKMAKL
ncbi:ribonuclease P/MRP protein subunit POP5 [Anopheles maculipalpis]|uniref:ribonuclease P/MRP protein subunit POP5 n=1 Tax=Anopheles maculipalpis TaxID=1496333 RepID=UPI002159132D|nr:ribonuclease P/MRP protein subunit POP5 [Anopheles maculipalpis]